MILAGLYLTEIAGFQYCNIGKIVVGFLDMNFQDSTFDVESIPFVRVFVR